MDLDFVVIENNKYKKLTLKFKNNIVGEIPIDLLTSKLQFMRENFQKYFQKVR